MTANSSFIPDTAKHLNLQRVQDYELRYAQKVRN